MQAEIALAFKPANKSQSHSHTVKTDANAHVQSWHQCWLHIDWIEKKEFVAALPVGCFAKVQCIATHAAVMWMQCLLSVVGGLSCRYTAGDVQFPRPIAAHLKFLHQICGLLKQRCSCNISPVLGQRCRHLSCIICLVAHVCLGRKYTSVHNARIALQICQMHTQSANTLQILQL